MKVAVAGTGPVAQYLMEELHKYGHEVVVLTRAIKPHLQRYSITQRETDYSVNSLVEVLHDCEGLVSTINNMLDPGSAATIHLNMLEACQQSSKCKRYIPSEWTGNVEDHPEQPLWDAGETKPLYEKLRAQTEIKWTIVCMSWFADYVVTSRHRHLQDIDQLWPMDYSTKTFTIYGEGTQVVNLTSTRDTARAVAMLFAHDGGWDEYTYLSGDQMSWNELFATVKKHDPEWTSKSKPLADTVRQIVANESEMSVLAASFEILSYANASLFPMEKVLRQRAKYFQGMHFRSIDELIVAATAHPEKII